MKFTLKSTLGLLVGVVFFYTACKKTSNAPATQATQTPTEQAVSGQIAANFAQTLAGAYGGVNINDGVNAPAFASNSTSAHAINTLHTNSACGFFVDSNINIKTNTGGIKSTTTGDIEFHFKCGPSGKSTGFDVFDSLKTTGTAPGYSFTNIVIQDYDVKALDAALKHISLDGSLKSWVDIVYNNKSIVPFSLHTKFILDGLKIDLTGSPFDIDEGTATFVSDGSSSAGSFHYTGKIEFLGNHKAKVTINGFVFHVNFLTGVVTPG